jgi:hypothetical protein
MKTALIGWVFDFGVFRLGWVSAAWYPWEVDSLPSANADFLRQSQIERLRGLSHHDRLRLFIDHSALMKRLSEVGAAMRAAPRVRPEQGMPSLR